MSTPLQNRTPPPSLQEATVICTDIVKSSTLWARSQGEGEGSMLHALSYHNAIIEQAVAEMNKTDELEVHINGSSPEGDAYIMYIKGEHEGPRLKRAEDLACLIQHTLHENASKLEVDGVAPPSLHSSCANPQELKNVWQECYDPTNPHQIFIRIGIASGQVSEYTYINCNEQNPQGRQRGVRGAAVEHAEQAERNSPHGGYAIYDETTTPNISKVDTIHKPTVSLQHIEPKQFQVTSLTDGYIVFIKKSDGEMYDDIAHIIGMQDVQTGCFSNSTVQFVKTKWDQTSMLFVKATGLEYKTMLNNVLQCLDQDHHKVHIGICRGGPHSFALNSVQYQGSTKKDYFGPCVNIAARMCTTAENQYHDRGGAAIAYQLLRTETKNTFMDEFLKNRDDDETHRMSHKRFIELYNLYDINAGPPNCTYHDKQVSVILVPAAETENCPSLLLPLRYPVTPLKPSRKQSYNLLGLLGTKLDFSAGGMARAKRCIVDRERQERRRDLQARRAFNLQLRHQRKKYCSPSLLHDAQ